MNFAVDKFQLFILKGVFMKFLITVFLTLFVLATSLFSAGHHHHAAAFLGATTGTYTDGHTSLTVGLEYEYIFSELSPKIGVGFIGEMVFAEHSETVFALPFIVHPIYDLKVFVAPALIMFSEEIPGQKDPFGNEIVTTESSNEWFVRIGAGWDFHFDQFSVSPLLSADLIAGKLYLVYGLSFGIGF